MNKLFAAVTAPRLVTATPLNRVFVRDLVMDASIGVYDHEKTAPQRIRVNLDLDVVGSGVTGEDGVAVIRAIAGHGHTTLIETLAERIAARCLEDARVRRVVVRVEKLDVFPDAASVGVEIERARP